MPVSKKLSRYASDFFLVWAEAVEHAASPEPFSLHCGDSKKATALALQLYGFRQALLKEKAAWDRAHKSKHEPYLHDWLATEVDKIVISRRGPRLTFNSPEYTKNATTLSAILDAQGFDRTVAMAREIQRQKLEAGDITLAEAHNIPLEHRQGPQLPPQYRMQATAPPRDELPPGLGFGKVDAAALEKEKEDMLAHIPEDKKD